MSKLRNYLHTTTRREKILLFVFFCILLVFAYIQFLVKPLEEKIYAQEILKTEDPIRRYREEEVQEILEREKDKLGAYGPVKEVDRQLDQEKDYTLHVFLEVETEKDQVSSFLKALKESTYLQGQKLTKEKGNYRLEVDLAFPLNLDVAYWPTPASPDQGPQEEVKNVKAERQQEPVQLGDKEAPRSSEKPNPAKKTEKAGPKKITTKPVEKPKVKEVVKKREERKLKEVTPLPPAKKKEEKKDLQAKTAFKAKEKPSFQDFQVYGAEESNLILRELEDGYEFSYFSPDQDSSLYEFSFQPLPARNLGLEAKSDRLGKVYLLSLTEDQVLQIYSYEEALEKNISTIGIYYEPLEDQRADILHLWVKP